MKRMSIWLVAATALAATPAFAQTATPLDRFEPSPAGDGFVAVPEPHVLGHGRVAAGAALSFAKSPLVIAMPSGDGVDEVAQVVSHQLMLHNLASIELLHRLKVELDVPFMLHQDGDGTTVGTLMAPSPSGAALADVRTSVRVEALRQSGGWPSAALSMSVWFPSGDEAAYSGAGVVRYAPQLIIGADYDVFSWSAYVGRHFQPETETPSLLGSEVRFGAALGPRIGPLRVALEIYGSTGSDSQLTAFERTSTNLEALISAAWHEGPFDARIFGGPGISRGVGTPDYRVGLMIGYAPDAEPHDQREDVEPPGERVMRESPPPIDGRFPAVDARANADRDRVPEPPAPQSPEPATAAAPPPTAEPDGAPVRIVGDQIVILERVEFATGRDSIDPSSIALLEQVSKVLRDHPEIARVGVDGHTDDVGAEAANIALSQRRAVAVVRWMTDHGIDARRLEARGFGPRQPIGDNATPKGRRDNRRVEFQILRRSSDGSAGWTDGTDETK